VSRLSYYLDKISAVDRPMMREKGLLNKLRTRKRGPSRRPRTGRKLLNKL
jgi:hypothetical protein